jgi:hypothetical protein
VWGEIHVCTNALCIHHMVLLHAYCKWMHAYMHTCIHATAKYIARQRQRKQVNYSYTQDGSFRRLPQVVFEPRYIAMMGNEKIILEIYLSLK